MPFIDCFDKIPAFTIKRRLGYPRQCGWSMCGWSKCGDLNEFSGVYQTRRNRKWNGIGGFIIAKKQRNFFQKPAWPTNTITPRRTEVRTNFASAVFAWQSLTDEQKKAYNAIGMKKSKRGYEVFLSQFLKSI